LNVTTISNLNNIVLSDYNDRVNYSIMLPTIHWYTDRCLYFRKGLYAHLRTHEDVVYVCEHVGLFTAVTVHCAHSHTQTHTRPNALHKSRTRVCLCVHLHTQILSNVNDKSTDRLYVIKIFD